MESTYCYCFMNKKTALNNMYESSFLVFFLLVME